MKNYLLLTASAVLVLSSCSNNEIVENRDLKTDGPKAMNFQTYVPGATRAINAQEATDVSVEEKGFYLFTDLTKLVEGKEEQVKGKMSFLGDGVWAMGEDQLEWPVDLNKEVHFCAVYTDKAEDEFNVVQTGDFGEVLSGFDLTSGENDYMIAKDTSSYKTANGNVTLNFSHILSQVEVRIGGTIEDYNYEVAGVVLSAPQSSIYQIADEAFYVEDDETTDYTLYNGISADGVTVVDGLPVALFDKYAEQTQVYSKIMVVPGTCYLRLKYRIYADGENPQWSSIGYEGDDQNFPFEVQAGFRNIVNVRLNPSTRAMTFTVEVEPWNNAPDDNDLDL